MRTYLRGGYPSEPFLAEAAAHAIFKKCRIKASDAHQNIQWAETEDIIKKIIQIYKTDIPSAILALSEGGLIDQGHSGELVVRMLCTLAHDILILKNPSFTHDYQVVKDEVSFSKMIPVINFLHALILEEYIGIVLKARPRNIPGKMLEEAFKNSFVHFTQFVKAGDKSHITDEGAYLLFVRAAAIQGYGKMKQACLLIPMWIPRHHNDDKPNRWSMTAIFIQVKNGVNNAFTFIDIQKTFQFFSQTQGHEEHPYITIAMDLEVLASQQPEQESVQESKAKGKGKNSPTTSFESNFNFCPEDPGSCAPVETFSLKLQQTLREILQAHSYPRYEISIMGCSKKVYNVIGEVSYSSLLAHKNMLTEHPRCGKYLDAIRHMKPYWKAKLSYDWVGIKDGNRLGANVVGYQDAKEVMFDGMDDSDEEY
ncbi:hypothetical protein C0993_003224 [Termitomyces sp. T159_Od127]|nr:hypothetical protein C0993_003224 [Termitomyces sp. T159_Od127]